MKIQFVLSQSNACLVIEKKKKKDRRSPIFWLYILACILCCLSALINIHAHVYKTSNCVANSCFGKFSLQIAFKFKGSLWKKMDFKRFANVGHMLQCHLACHQIQNHLLSTVGISQVLCTCSDILHPYEFLSCPKT